MKKRLPNMITACRLPLSLALLLCEALSPVWLTLYLLCGLSDLLDGLLARRWRVCSTLGSRLDWLADLCFVVCALLSISRAWRPPVWALWCVAAVAALRVAAYISLRARLGEWRSLHTHLNKLTGLLLFLLPCALAMRDLTTPHTALLCALALLSAAEELLIALLAPAPEPDTTGLFAAMRWLGRR